MTNQPKQPDAVERLGEWFAEQLERGAHLGCCARIIHGLDTIDCTCRLDAARADLEEVRAELSVARCNHKWSALPEFGKPTIETMQCIFCGATESVSVAETGAVDHGGGRPSAVASGSGVDPANPPFVPFPLHEEMALRISHEAHIAQLEAELTDARSRAQDLEQQLPQPHGFNNGKPIHAGCSQCGGSPRS